MAAAEQALTALGIGSSVSGAAIGGAWRKTGGKSLTVTSPIDRRTLATVQEAAPADVEAVIDAAADAFRSWRTVPAPRRRAASFRSASR